jgi:hypothetical protein
VEGCRLPGKPPIVASLGGQAPFAYSYRQVRRKATNVEWVWVHKRSKSPSISVRIWASTFRMRCQTCAMCGRDA